MNADLAIEIGRDALVMLMLVSAPMLLLGMLVGVIMSIFQAATQIQEQTLAFVPKIVAVFVSIVIFGPWMLGMLVSFIHDLFKQIPLMIR